MKNLFKLFLLLWSSVLLAQADILIIGTVHHFNQETIHLQNFEKIQEAMVAFNPDIICIESIPIADTLSLKEVRSRSLEKADSLRELLSSGKIFSTIPATKAAKLYASYDFWNAYFLWDSQLRNNQSIEPFKDFHLDLSNSEFGNIIFPATRKLNIEYLHNIDFRDGEKEFLANQNLAFKKLLFKLKLKPLRAYLKIQKKYKEAESQGELVEFINGQEFQNAFSSLIDELPSKLKRLDAAKFVKNQWHYRNEIMANRISDASKEANAKKVIVAVGSAHVFHIKLYLEKLGHHVITYDQVNNTKK